MIKEGRQSFESNFIGTVRLLLNAGVDPKIEDKYGRAPLSIASQWVYAEIGKVLKESNEVEMRKKNI